MFFTVSITPIIWFNLLLCIASDKNETSHLPNFGAADEIITNNTNSGVSDSFDYNNFEPLFSSEFLFDPSQFIDFAQVSEIEDISSRESNSATDLFTITPHPGFISPSYDDFIVHTNLESLLDSNLDSYRNVWKDANGELKTNDDKARYPIIRDAQSGTSSPLNVNTDDIITYMYLPGSQQNVAPVCFHQLTLSSDDTSGQHGNTEESNIDNTSMKNQKQVNEGSKTDNRKYICYYPGCTVIATNYNEYVTHRKAHGQALIYECRVPGCGRTFDHRTSFCSHIQTHQPKHQCKNCGKLFCRKNILQKHNKHCGTPLQERSYECVYRGCTMVTKDYKEYIAHRKAHGQPFIYECKVPGCGRTFDRKPSFYNHKQTHESHHECKCCGKFFSTKNGLQKHKKNCPTKFHKRGYECLYPGCAVISKSFNDNLKHKRTHNGPFIYECKVPGCGRTFYHESSLRDHKQTHGPRCQCEGCGKFFYRMSVLKLHKKSCSKALR
ncbi:Zinc finger C2H2 type family protein [Brugia pahangi]